MSHGVHAVCLQDILLALPHRSGNGVARLAVGLEVEPAVEWYKRELKQGEGVWKGTALSFSDDKIEFEFYIWNEGDANCCPTAGKVRGTYKIVKENTYDSQKRTWVDKWRMAVETALRQPIQER